MTFVSIVFLKKVTDYQDFFSDLLDAFHAVGGKSKPVFSFSYTKKGQLISEPTSLYLIENRTFIYFFRQERIIIRGFDSIKSHVPQIPL